MSETVDNNTEVPTPASAEPEEDDEDAVSVEAIEVAPAANDDDESALLEDVAEHVDDEEEEDDDVIDDVVDDDDEELEADEVTEEASTVTPTRKDEKGEAAPTTPPTTGGKRRARRSSIGSSAKRGRAPSVAGLSIPFRTVKKAMKLDADTPIVQNEAAIAVTMATELFLKKLAKDSFRNAKNRGRNTIRYEDIAESRTKKSSLSFLETLFP